MLDFKKGRMVSEFGKPWEKPKLNRCFITECCRVCIRLTDGHCKSLKKGHRRRYFSNSFQNITPSWHRIILDYGSKGIYFGKHQLVILRHRPDPSITTCNKTRNDVCEDYNFTNYSLNIQASPCLPKWSSRKGGSETRCDTAQDARKQDT